jgi:hypothetical protein
MHPFITNRLQNAHAIVLKPAFLYPYRCPLAFISGEIKVISKRAAITKAWTRMLSIKYKFGLAGCTRRKNDILTNETRYNRISRIENTPVNQI